MATPQRHPHRCGSAENRASKPRLPRGWSHGPVRHWRSLDGANAVDPVSARCLQETAQFLAARVTGLLSAPQTNQCGVALLPRSRSAKQTMTLSILEL